MLQHGFSSGGILGLVPNLVWVNWISGMFTSGCALKQLEGSAEVQDSSWEGPDVAADQTSVGMCVPQRGHIWTDGCLEFVHSWKHGNASCAFSQEWKWNWSSHLATHLEVFCQQGHTHLELGWVHIWKSAAQLGGCTRLAPCWHCRRVHICAHLSSSGAHLGASPARKILGAQQCSTPIWASSGPCIIHAPSCSWARKRKQININLRITQSFPISPAGIQQPRVSW